MKKIFLALTAALLFISLNPSTAQNSDRAKAFQMLQQRGEVCFWFALPEKSNPKNFLKNFSYLSIDKIENGEVFAYANSNEFQRFLKQNIAFRVATPPSMKLSREILDRHPSRSVQSWDYYPTYEEYVDLMNGFANDYPDLCELVNIGQTVEGRDLLFIHINDSLGTDQNEPEFMYTATMHGDETTPYVLMLHLIDYLLSNYGTDPKVTDLVNNLDIWINPLANPDGTYAGGNNTVYGATRYNGNNIDLNRNYPDPEDGPHPDGNSYQPETVAFMNLADIHDFVLSCNMHTGAEVANYPWDTWSRLTADDDWWRYVCRQYADTVHAYAPAGYFTDLNNGITNGYTWYEVDGGRQDYMNYFQHCREFTLELSHTKTPPPSQLPDFWEYNYHSFLNFMQQALYGVRGIVTNKQNGMPVKAKVFVENHDMDNSFVYSSLPEGNYHRPIKAGSYSFTFSAFGYYDQTIDNVTPSDEHTLYLNVQLHPRGVMIADFYASDTLLLPGMSADFYDNSYSDSIAAYQWSFPGGQPDHSAAQNPCCIVYDNPGEYDVSLTITDTSGATKTVTKPGYIRVMDGINMQNGLFTTCQTLFYDSGGETGDYSDNEDLIMTFAPATPNSVIRVQFTRFNLESSMQCRKDYLSVYDGSDTNALLLGTWCGDDIPAVFVAQNDGNLTFEFHSDDSVHLAGWKAFVNCDTNTGIATRKINKVHFYPNPARDHINITAPYPITSVELYDMNGKLICNTAEITGTTAILNTGNCPDGIYLLKTNCEKGFFTNKLLINKNY